MPRAKGDTLKWFNSIGCRRIPRKDQWMNSIEPLRIGYNTAEISIFKAVPEYQVYNEIHHLREVDRMKTTGR